MNNKQSKSQEQEPDPHLDVPSEANRDKHINFRKLEEDGGELLSFKDKDEVKERREQWEQGVEEGRKERHGGTPND